MEQAGGSSPPLRRGQQPWQNLETDGIWPQTTPATLAPVPNQRSSMILMVSLVLTVLALLFSFLSMVIMATNKKNKDSMIGFKDVKEFKYLLAIATIAFLYSVLQLVNLFFQLVSKISNPGLQRLLMTLAFVGSQLLAYLLISASSAAIAIIGNLCDIYKVLHEYDLGPSPENNPFYKKAAASASMAFMAFVFFSVCAILFSCKVFKT